MLKRTIYALDGSLEDEFAQIWYTDFPKTLKCEVICGKGTRCNVPVYTTIVHFSARFAFTKCKCHFDQDCIKRLDVFDEPVRWMFIVARRFYKKNIPKDLIYRIAKEIAFGRVFGLISGEWVIIKHAYISFYYAVDNYANRCISLLWKINRLHKDIRLLLARQLWKDRQSWLDLIELPWKQEG